MAITDPLFGQQWYLQALGGDMQKIWSEYTGKGVHTAIYDDGLQSTHADLKGNYDASREIFVNGVRSDPNLGTGVHGTSVAGIIAAGANNGIGGVGIASGSGITGVDIFSGAASGSGMLNAIRQMANFDTVNNSWNWQTKYADPISVSGSFGQQFNANIAYGTTAGRGGLGTIIVDSAGNDWGTDRRDANTSEFAAARQTITVGGVTDNGDVAYYANRGSSILVSAPTSGGSKGMVTTDRTGAGGYDAGDYTSTFGGTSGAAPIVTAVSNLMLEANKGLGWRDVQDILAITAMHTGGNLSGGLSGNMAFGWTINHANNVNGGGLHFSNDVGFGSVNAFEAVRMAEVYSNFGAAGTSANEQRLTASATVNKAIADNQSQSFTFVVAGGVSVEHADLTLTLSHANVNDLRVELISPGGTNSIVLTPGTGTAISQTNWSWTFGSEAFRGEMSAGTWTVKVTDTATGSTGTLASAKLDLYGDAASANDVYHYTSEFAKMAALDPSRTTLSDTNGGNDWIDAAVLTGNVNLDLHAGATSTVNGQTLVRIAAGTTIENGVTGDGNDVLSGNDAANRLMGMRGNDVLEGYGGADTLDGGAGIDTATYLHSAAGVDVDLIRATQIGGDAQGDTLVSIENLTGSAFADTLRGDAGINLLVGGAGNDVLEGRGGADVLDGGIGLDTASYASSSAAVDVDLARAAQIGGDAQGDTFVSIENVTGSAFADTLRGDAGANVLSGGAGNDLLEGRGGADVLDGGAGIDTADYARSAAGIDVDLLRATQVGGDAQGDSLVSVENVTGTAYADTLRGDAGANVLLGGAGNDVLEGRGGADTIDGGAGVDTVSYASSSAGVDIDMNRATQLGGDAQGDTLVSVEAIVGSNFADRINGGTALGQIQAGGGDDVIVASMAAQKIDGGDGIDLVDYSNSTAAVSVNLATGLNSGGFAQSDVLTSIENVTGSTWNDTLYGNSGANVLSGGAGNDYLDGGAGNDRLFGGAGSDRLLGGDGNDYLDGGAGNDILTGGAGMDLFAFTARGWGTDTITDFKRGEDVLDLRGTGLTFADVRIAMSGTTETLTFGQGVTDSIVLAMQSTRVTQTDFLFA